MRIVAPKTRGLIAVVAATALLVLNQNGVAQDGTNVSEANSAQAPPASGPSIPSGEGVPSAPAAAPDQAGTSTAATGLDYFYNKKPVDGSAASQASAANAVMVQREAAADALNLGPLADPKLREAFDNYLTTSEVPAPTLAAYGTEMQRVIALLQANQTFAAWKELYTLAQYQKIDAGVSRELANRVESIWNDGRATDQLRQQDAQLKQDINTGDRNADVLSERLREEDILHQRQAAPPAAKTRRAAPVASPPNGGVPLNPQGDDGTNPTPVTASVSGLEGRLELTQEYLNTLEARANIKLNQLKAQKLIDQAKKDFVEYIQTLYTTGRYQHVVLAADFYRKIFDEDNYPVDIENQVNASLESARDVENSVEVFKYDLAKNQVASATMRLLEAFTHSELDPAVLGLDRSLKEKSEDYLTRLDKMENLIEARDFGTLEGLIPGTVQMASDFDSTKALALVNAVKLDSKLHLGKAKLAAQGGNLKDAMDEFEEAAKAWPGNPDLQDASSQFFQTEDVKNQSVTEFDRLLEENNFRAIFEKQLAFAPAIHGDSKREAAFATAIKKIKDAEFAAEKADEMRNAGDVCGAWETVELASKDLPGDNKLNSLRAELAGRAAEFVAAINNAKDAETRSDLGYSLSWYAVAQHYYPASSIANDGIARVSNSILSSKGG
jgi:hypothetical protein